MPRYASLRGEYARRWRALTVSRVAAVDAAARDLIANRARYEAVVVGSMPWWLIAALHWREASGSFAGVLHNGERIIGTGRKTRLEPKGRGPFSSWEEAAIDALRLKRFQAVAAWPIERCAYAAETYNGFGYRSHKLPSAYLWSFSNQYSGGKYVADGVFNRGVKDAQIGVMPLIARMAALDPSIVIPLEDNAAPVTRPAPASSPAPIVLSEDDARLAQERLRALGYAEAGAPNGDWGTRSAAALTAFQIQEGLAVTSGTPDAATLDRLFDVRTKPRPVSTERATATVSELRPQSAVLQASYTSKAWSAVLAAGGTLYAAGQGVLSYFGDASAKLAPVREFFGAVPGEVWAIAAVGIAYGIWRASAKAENAKVAAYRDGTDAGPA